MSKISLLPAATLPLTGAEPVPIVQGGETRQAPFDSLSAAATAVAVEAAATAQAVAVAAGNYASSKAAGEAASALGELFSYPDGAGGLIYAERTAGGSTEIARSLTQATAQLVLDSTAAITARTFPASYSRVQTRGFAAVNDGGAALYTRWTVGMTALPAPAEGIWWFTASDGSKWQMAEHQTFMLPMFGAMGDPGLTRTSIAQAIAIGTDDRARIQAALDAPMVQELIVTRQHWYGDDLRKPTGKHLRGIGRTKCGFHRIPLVGNQVAPKLGIYAEDDEAGAFSDFFINVQRSGWNPALAHDNLQHQLNRCNGLVIRRDSRNVRVTCVDVFNAWGYSHYTCAGATGNAGPTPRNILRRECRAYNGDTCFQITGLGASETIVDCWGYKDPIDGGISLYMECAFHSYSGVARLHRIRCGFVGSAPAVLDSTADGLDSNTIINEDCDFRTTGGQFAITVNNPDPDGESNPGNVGKKVLDYRIINTRAAPDRVFTGGAAPYAVHATHANVRISGGEFLGIGIFSGNGGKIVIDGGPGVSALIPAGPLAAIALTTDGTGEIDWHGKTGFVTAVHGETPGLANTGYGNAGVTFHDIPELTPAPAGGSAPQQVEILQEISGHKTAAEMTNAGYVVPPNYWFELVMPQPVVDWDRMTWDFMVQRDDNNTTGPAWSASYRFMSSTTVQIYINSPGLAGCTLRYTVSERA